MTSAVWNPIIYSFFNPQFLEFLKRRRQSQVNEKLFNLQQLSKLKKHFSTGYHSVRYQPSQPSWSSTSSTKTAEQWMRRWRRWFAPSILARIVANKCSEWDECRHLHDELQFGVCISNAVKVRKRKMNNCLVITKWHIFFEHCRTLLHADSSEKFDNDGTFRDADDDSLDRCPSVLGHMLWMNRLEEIYDFCRFTALCIMYQLRFRFNQLVPFNEMQRNDFFGN